MKIENMKTDSRFAKGFGVYVMSDAESRAAWTGETIEQAQAAIDAESPVSTGKATIEQLLASVRRNAGVYLP
jgi:hypothetical protein